MTWTLGIDPGMTGALAYVGDGDLKVVDDMPVVDGLVNATLLAGLVQDRMRMPSFIKEAVLEQVHAMPRQGVSSTFKFGRGYGVIEGVLGTLRIPVRYVTPAKWTGDLRVGADKELHRRRAIETWPGSADLFKRKKDDGRADAALIAEWGRTH